jgi:phage terminase small subunit
VAVVTPDQRRLTLRQANFLNEIALGNSVASAATAAGYSKSYSRRGCYNLLRQPAVLNALEEIRRTVQERTELTAERYMTKLETAYVNATAANQHTAAARLLELQGKLAGLLIDRQQTLVGTVDMTAALAEAKARAANVLPRMIGNQPLFEV